MTNLVILPTKSEGALVSKKAATATNTDLLALLGDQLKIDQKLLTDNPEIAKLMESSPEGLNFEDLLEQLQDGDIEIEGVDASDIEQLSKSDLDKKALAIGNTQPKVEGEEKAERKSLFVDPTKNANHAQLQETKFTRARAAEEAALNKTKSIFAKPTTAQTSSPEMASKAFIPQRKSMFNIAQKQAPQAIVQETVKNNNLMDLNTFVANQSHSAKMKMAVTSDAYKPAISQSMFAAKIEADAPKLTNSIDMNQNSIKASDFVLNNQASAESNLDFAGNQNSFQTQNNITQTNGAETKVFDMSAMTNSGTTQEVIAKIQDYVIQARASSEPTVQMSFKHPELGQVDLTLQKMNGEISILINSHTAEGSKFFAKNHSDLMQNLTQSGVRVADIKLDTSSNLSSQDNTSDSSSREQNQQHAGQNRNQRDADSRRREELWDLFKNREAA